MVLVRALMVSVLMLAAAAPAWAADWTPYANARYGYAIDVPASYKGQGESDAGDGQVFQTAKGAQSLRVWGGFVIADTLAQDAKALQGNYQEDGWAFSYNAGKAGWVSFSGTKGDQVLYVRMISYCGGKQYAAFALQYPKADLAKMNKTVDHLVHSLSGNTCS